MRPARMHYASSGVSVALEANIWHGGADCVGPSQVCDPGLRWRKTKGGAWRAQEWGVWWMLMHSRGVWWMLFHPLGSRPRGTNVAGVCASLSILPALISCSEKTVHSQG